MTRAGFQLVLRVAVAQTLNSYSGEPWISDVCVVGALASEGLDQGDNALPLALKGTDHLMIELGKPFVVVGIGEAIGTHLSESLGYRSEVRPPRPMFWRIGTRANPKRKRVALIFNHSCSPVGILRDRRTGHDEKCAKR